MVQTIQNRGYYPYVTTPDEVAHISATPGRSDEIFLQEALKVVQRWLEYADAKLAGTGMRCYVCPGNDDMMEIDPVLRGSKIVEIVEGKVIHLDEHHEMISTGWSNPTPVEHPPRGKRSSPQGAHRADDRQAERHPQRGVQPACAALRQRAG